MLHFLGLVGLCAIFIYVVERRLRHAIQKQGISPFDETLLKVMSIFARLCREKAWCSNLILVISLIFSFYLVAIDTFLYSDGIKEPTGIFTSIALLVQFLSISVAASFKGKTWINSLRVWIQTWSDRLLVRILKRVIFEGLFLVTVVLLFVLMTMAGLFSYANGSDSVVRVQMIFYFLPIFFVMWVYRIGDYDDFNLNVRRFIVYILVATAVFLTKDPITQLTTSNSKPQSIFDFGHMLNEFSILAFLTLDRIGKVIIELLSKPTKGSVSKNNQ